VPADLLVVYVGIQARSGVFPLWLAWLVLVAATRKLSAGFLSPS